jgi:hypothetical protein
MTNSDLGSRPVFHHQREAIEAHLTVVVAALGVSRYLQPRTGQSCQKLVQTLRAARSAPIENNRQQLTLDPDVTSITRAIIDRLNRVTKARGTSQGGWRPWPSSPSSRTGTTSSSR